MKEEGGKRKLRLLRIEAEKRTTYLWIQRRRPPLLSPSLLFLGGLFLLLYHQLQRCLDAYSDANDAGARRPVATLESCVTHGSSGKEKKKKKKRRRYALYTVGIGSRSGEYGCWFAVGKGCADRIRDKHF
ncbi:hypothetical protein PIB30_017681 [Stylosanthes scabra]|uniref:Uncharacterized protein n=1 Tax=Stylosanthes scabra TaxID=79078 RepID=A0ABU6Z592_9FABA|nr:hypothetical protein [Stylosanthes scabra]